MGGLHVFGNILNEIMLLYDWTSRVQKYFEQNYVARRMDLLFNH
jgi:hypothetical protein